MVKFRITGVENKIGNETVDRMYANLLKPRSRTGEGRIPRETTRLTTHGDPYYSR